MNLIIMVFAFCVPGDQRQVESPWVEFPSPGDGPVVLC